LAAGSTACAPGIGGSTVSSGLRDALSEQWAQRIDVPALPKRLILDVVALVGLSVALVISFTLSSVATGVATGALESVGTGGAWAPMVQRGLAIALALLVSFEVFLMVLALLPREHVGFRRVANAALLGAVGFEVVKQLMSVYLRLISGSPSAAIFGSLIGLLIFIYVACRFTLFVTALAATAEDGRPAPCPVPAPAILRPEVVVRSAPGPGVTAGLLGMGMIVGAIGIHLVGRQSS
jgi:membrane protein